MNSLLQKVRKHRYGLLVLVALLLAGVSLLTRIALLIYASPEINFTFGSLLGIFLIGLFYDLVNTSYFTIPLVIYLWLVPHRLFQKKWHRYVLVVVLFNISFMLVFNSFSEWFFWEEFNTRFNFIAVDYLVYTNEVIGNIVESYPIGWYIASAVLVTGLIVFISFSWIKNSHESTMRFKQRTPWALAILCVPVLCFFTIDSSFRKFNDNALVNELAGNGLYELFAAYRNNELNYNQFYSTINDDVAFATMKKLLKTEEAEYLDPNGYSYERHITADSAEEKLNVIMISVESLSARYMEYFDYGYNVMPFLDSLVSECLFYSNFYATGTRTVRGLEALSLCVPPTPGQSIVRRPGNEGLFTLGKVFSDKGYDTKYIYGGYGYFDNMNYFFANNSYEVVDRMALKEEEIDYENIWGVADENLFELAEREIEESINNGKPVFAHIMTTSNHRPYTYPEGRIDIPSHSGRQGAVKYTDYAIGRFVKTIRKKPWFKNSIVVIVADHCASSAGATEVPVDKYHIPLWIYAPGRIEPRVEDRLMSQIDLGPTLLGMLNFSYDSKFFGYDLAKLEPGRERAFISTYQSLGYVKGNKVVILDPQKKAECFEVREGNMTKLPTVDKELLEEAISWYQSSSYAFKNKLMRAN